MCELLKQKRKKHVQIQFILSVESGFDQKDS